eukprot:g10918.t1
MLVQQLAGLLNGRSLSVIELGDLYCYRYGVPVSRALELLGRRSTLKEFLKDNAEHFSMQAGCVMQKETSNNDTARETSLGGLNQRYLDLDAEITNCKSVEENRQHRNVDAEALLLVNGSSTAPIDRAQWLPPLLAVVLQRESTEESWGLEIGKSKDGVFIQSVVTVSPAIEQWNRENPDSPLHAGRAILADLKSKAHVSVVEDAVRVAFPGATVSLSLDSVSGPSALAAERRARLFAKIPRKWWRNQQDWSSECRPCDLLLEELVASTANSKLSDQAEAVAAAFRGLEGFEQASNTSIGYFDHHQLVDFAAQSGGSLINSGAEIYRYMQLRRVQVGWGSDFEDAPDHMDELLERLGGAKVVTLVLVAGDTSDAGRVPGRLWTSSLRRTIETAQFIEHPELLESVMSHLERIQQPIMIISHQAVLRMMYGWLMHLNREDAIETQVPQHMVVRITFDGLGNPPVERRFPLGPMQMADDGQKNL